MAEHRLSRSRGHRRRFPPQREDRPRRDRVRRAAAAHAVPREADPPLLGERRRLRLRPEGARRCSRRASGPTFPTSSGASPRAARRCAATSTRATGSTSAGSRTTSARPRTSPPTGRSSCPATATADVRALVTGGSGFVGRHLAALLRGGGLRHVVARPPGRRPAGDDAGAGRPPRPRGGRPRRGREPPGPRLPPRRPDPGERAREHARRSGWAATRSPPTTCSRRCAPTRPARACS